MSVDFKEPLIDSRKLILAKNSRFYAIRGVNNDGHQYINELYGKGVRDFIVERPVDNSNYPEAKIERVDSTVERLQRDAIAYRNRFQLPVVAITGSNGKTIVKEWLSRLLEAEHTVCQSPKSYNSQVGVPLSIFQINSNHTFGVFEAGISLPGEMEKLEPIIQPDFGIFTNIGSAHDSGFKNREEKVEEKLKLFRECSLLIYRSDYGEIKEAVDASGLKALCWSHALEADIKVTRSGNEVTFDYEGKSFVFKLPFTDKASFENLMHCIVFLISQQWTQAKIQQGLNSLTPVSMRLEVKQGINDCYVIDDSYNNDLAGLQIALEFLEENKQHQKRTVILSDIYQSGLDDETLYSKVNELLKARNIHRVILIGEKCRQFASVFDVKVVNFFPTTEALLSAVVHFENEIVLVKGAREFKFERIVKKLSLQSHRTFLEVNLDSLVNNLHFYKSKLRPETKIMVMVKAFAYGGGSHEIANLLQYHQVSYLAVAYADEGIDLRNHGITIPIMVMNPNRDDFANIIKYDLEPEIYSFTILTEWLDFLELKDIKLPIHLKVDTGMHRLGFEPEDQEKLIQILSEKEACFQVKSIFSHLASADDDAEFDFTMEQVRKYNQFASGIEQSLNYSVLKHILNSSGILSIPEMQLDMVRLGIGLYGYDPTEKHQDELETVTEFKSIISQIKKIEKGETIGYSRAGRAHDGMTIATIPVGYADGYFRAFSNGKGEVYIKGRRFPVVGNVCMDMIMVDITGADCVEGDEVELFGSNVKIQELAKRIGTIPYEILTNISERVKRIYYKE